MQASLDSVTTAKSIHILGINLLHMESGNAGMCDGRVLPWLQDTDAAQVWGSWHAATDDVIILDAENQVIQTYSLYDHTLIDPTNYATLKGILLGAAR